MVDNENPTSAQSDTPAPRTRRRAASRPAGPPVEVEGVAEQAPQEAPVKAAAKKSTRAPRKTKAQASEIVADMAAVEQGPDEAPAKATKGARAPIAAAFVAPVFIAPEPVSSEEGEKPKKSSNNRKAKAKPVESSADETAE